MQTRSGNPALAALHGLVPSDAQQTLDTRSAAQLLGLSYWTLVSWRRQGNAAAPKDLPWFYDRGKVVYRASDLRAYLARNAAEMAA